AASFAARLRGCRLRSARHGGGGPSPRASASRGRSDGIVNNAGFFPFHPPLSTAYADWTAAWQHTLATNLIGPAHLSYCAARTMAEQGGGRILSVSSRAAFRGEPK